MENHKEQLNLFTEKDFEPRNTEQAKPSKPEPSLSWSDIFESSAGYDCFYYVCRGACALHGDAVGWMDCDDYRSINDDDTQDDDQTPVHGVAGE